MSTQNLLKLANEYMKIWNSGSDGILDVCAHQELKVYYTHFPKPCVGIEQYKLLLHETYRYFPDIRIEINAVTCYENRNKVAIEWKYEGTHKHGNLFGVEASGQRVAVAGITMLTVEQGLIAQETGIVDNLSLILQIGALKRG